MSDETSYRYAIGLHPSRRAVFLQFETGVMQIACVLPYEQVDTFLAQVKAHADQCEQASRVKVPSLIIPPGLQ